MLLLVEYKAYIMDVSVVHSLLMLERHKLASGPLLNYVQFFSSPCTLSCLSRFTQVMNTLTIVE